MQRSRREVFRLQKARFVEQAVHSGCDVKDLIVEAGNQINLSYQSETFKPSYKVIALKSIDEVKEHIGVAHETVNAFENQFQEFCQPAGLANAIKTRVVSVEELRSEDPQLRNEALGLTHAVARQYIYGNSNKLSHWKGTLDAYILDAGVKLNIAVLNDITVNSGATLTVLIDTHAVVANRIRIFEGGQIVCNGPKTFNCTSFEGNIRSRLVAAAADTLFG